jgi:hypothetical protein
MPEPPRGRPLALDPQAPSDDEALPAFLAKPAGAPVYHGFPLLDDVSVDGFVLGAITDFEAAPCDYGDAFVVAPDGSRAGLVWEVSSDVSYFEEAGAPEADRWGVWAVTFPHPMTSRDNARLNLAAILPALRAQWEAWRERQ